VRNPENPAEWDGFRVTDDPHGFGDWIRRYDMAFKIGTPGITFITKDPRDQGIDDQQNPVSMLYRAVSNACRQSQGLPDWPPLVMENPQGKPLTPITDGYVMKSIVMQHRNKIPPSPIGCQPQDPEVVFLMKSTAGEALINALVERGEDGNYKWPDIVDLNSGAFAQFHQPGTMQQFTQGPGATGRMGGAGGGGGGGMQNNRYECMLFDVFDRVQPVIPARIDYLADMIAAKTTMWDDIIWVPTIEEQVQMLSKCGLPDSAVVFALSEMYAEYIPDDVLERGAAQLRQWHGGGPVQGTDPMQPGAQPGQPQDPAGGGAPAMNPMAAAAAGQGVNPATGTPSPAVTDPALAGQMGAAAAAQPPVSQAFGPQPGQMGQAPAGQMGQPGQMGQAVPDQRPPVAAVAAALQGQVPATQEAPFDGAVPPVATTAQAAPPTVEQAEAAPATADPAAAAPPAGSPMGPPTGVAQGAAAATTQLAAQEAAAAQQPGAAQPTHADPARQSATMQALQGARNRANQ
jgi:hypothetical protein